MSATLARATVRNAPLKGLVRLALPMSNNLKAAPGEKAGGEKAIGVLASNNLKFFEKID